jgi:universal stress protein A
MIYHHALVAVDLSDDSKKVIEKAAQLAKEGVKITLMNIIEPIAFNLGGGVPMDIGQLQEEQKTLASDTINKNAQAVGLEAPIYVIFGSPKQEIHSFVKQNNCDLIVVGSHGRHGFALLLGSTTQELLQSSPCDLLSINLI